MMVKASVPPRTGEDEMKTAGQIISWLSEAQASGNLALAGMQRGRLIKLAWQLMRLGICTRNDVEIRYPQPPEWRPTNNNSPKWTVHGNCTSKLNLTIWNPNDDRFK